MLWKVQVSNVTSVYSVLDCSTTGVEEILIERDPNWKSFCDVILVTFFGDVMVTS